MRARLFLLALVASFGYFTFGLAVAWPAAALPSIRFDPSHLYITSSRFLTSMMLALSGVHNMYAYQHGDIYISTATFQVFTQPNTTEPMSQAILFPVYF